jgi:hypothetical protein
MATLLNRLVLGLDGDRLTVAFSRPWAKFPLIS